MRECEKAEAFVKSTSTRSRVYYEYYMETLYSVVANPQCKKKSLVFGLVKMLHG